MPIENDADVLVKTPQRPAGAMRGVSRWHGTITESELITAAENGNGNIERSGGMITLTGNIYLDEDCTLDFRNFTFDIRTYVIFIHPDANILWRDVQFVSYLARTGPNVTIFPEWGRWNADGGGILGLQRMSAALIADTTASAQTIRNKSRMHVFVGLINNVQIRQDSQSQNDIQYLPFLSSGTYRNVQALKVTGINTNGNTDVVNKPIIMHDCEYRSTSPVGTRLGVLNNGSMILNDCIFGRMDGQTPNANGNDNAAWMFENHAGGVTRVAHHVYFCGTTKTRWAADWKRDSTLDTQLQSHQGGLRYYQIYKEGAIFGGCRYRLYSDLDIGDGNPAVTAHRDSQITLDNNSILELPSASMGTDGEFDVMTIAKTRLNVSNSWNTHTQTNHVLRIRERTIQFQDVVISDPTISIGRPDTPVPLVVQPDRHFNQIFINATVATAQSRITLDHTTKTITLGNSLTWTVSALYSYLKILFTAYDNFQHDFDISFDGTTLRLPGWTFTIGENNIIYSSNGNRIICQTLTTIPSNTQIRAGVSIIDSTGIVVTVSSPAPDARAYLTYPGQSTPKYGALPLQEKIPLNKDVKVTVKAPGYIYQIYEFNTNNQTALDARLPLDPAIDLGIDLSIAEKQTMTVSSGVNAFWVPLSNANELEIFTSEINLYSQLGKSKRLVDHALSVNESALYFIHNYVDELTGSPLGGQPFLFGIDRMRIDDSKIQFRRTASVNSRCRLGVPVWRASNDMVYFAPIVTNLGSVHFDSLQAVADIPADVLASTVETITTNDTYTGVLSRAMWDYLSTEQYRDGSFADLIKTNLDAKVSESANKAQVGYFNIANREIAGGGLAAPILEGHGTGVHPQQLYLVERTPRLNGPYYHAKLQLYDISGGDDGAQYLGGEFIAGGATSPYEILAAEVNQDYLILGILAADGTTYQLHRIPLDTTDTSTTHAVLDLTFAPVAITINNTDIVIAKHANSTTTIYTVPLSYTASSTLTERIAHPLGIQANNTGMTMTGAGEDAAITLITGDRIIQMSAANYSYISNDQLPFTGHNVIWWQDHVWTIRIHDADNWYLQPLNENLEAIHTANIIHAIKQNAPENVWGVPFATASSVANSIGSALLSIPQGVWEVSDDNAQSASNSIGAALMDIIVVLDVLTLPGGGLNPTNLNKIAGIPAAVWNTSILNPTTGTMKQLIRDILTRLNTQNDAITALPAPPTTAAIRTALEADGGDLDTISNTVNSISERVQKIDGQTAATGSYGWVNFPSNTYATGYIAHDDILSLILQDTDASNHVIGKRIHTDTGLGIEDHTYHPITLTNKRIITVADSPTDTYFIVLDTDAGTYHAYQQNHGEQTTPISAQLTRTPKALAWGPHGLYVLEIHNGNLFLRWTYNSTLQEYDTEITAGAGTASMAIIGDIAYILHGGVLRAVRIADETGDAAMIDGVGASLQGDNLIVMHDVLWVYDDGRLYPLDGNHAPINTEWALTQRARIDDKITAVKGKTDKMTFNGTGTDDDPYLIDAHAGGITADDLTVDLGPTNDKIDAVKGVVDAIPTTSYTAVLTAIKAKTDLLFSSGDTKNIHTLQEISEAVRDLADYDDDGDSTTSLKATLDLILLDLTWLETQLGADDDGNSNITILKRLKNHKTILDKFRFTANDVKATLDGETVTTDAASRTASKATIPTDDITAIKAKTDKLNFNGDDDVKATLDGETVGTTTTYATPTDVTTAANGVKALLNSDSVDNTPTIFKHVKNAEADAATVKTELTTDAVDDGTGTSTNRDTIKKNIDDIETQTTADAISTAVEAAFLDDADGRAFLQQIYDKIEQAIEDESLAQNALAIAIRREVWQHIVNPDDAEADQVNAQSALNTAREQINDVVNVQLPAASHVLGTIATACNWLVSIGKADIKTDGTYATFIDRATKEEIIKFKNRGSAGKIDWGAGRYDPEDDADE